MSLIYIAGGIETIYIIVSYIIRYPLILSFLSDSCNSNLILYNSFRGEILSNFTSQILFVEISRSNICFLIGSLDNP